MKLNAPKIFSSDKEELKFVNDYFGKTESYTIENPKTQLDYKPITITKKEKTVLIQSMRYNNNFVMPFVASKEIIKSLSQKGFIEHNEKSKMYKVKRNVQFLFEIEGDETFDNILN